MRTEQQIRERLERLRVQAAKRRHGASVALTMQIVMLEWVLGETDLFEDED